MDTDTENNFPGTGLPTSPKDSLTRRELFSFIRTKPKYHSEEPASFPNPILTRRQFMQLIIGTSAALTANHYLGSKTEVAHAEPVTPYDNLVNTFQEDSPSYLQTSLEASLLTIADVISIPILKHFKIPFGNASIDKEHVKKIMALPFYQLITYYGMSATLEEAFARALPQLLFIGETPKSDFWQLGVPFSVVFALIHGIEKKDVTDTVIKKTKVIPLHQFVGGLFYWSIMRRRGFSHAVLAHSLNNVEAVMIGKLLYDKFPGDQKQPIT